MTKSSTFSIPLLLIVFVALATIPISVRAGTDAEDCLPSWGNIFSLTYVSQRCKDFREKNKATISAPTPVPPPPAPTRAPAVASPTASALPVDEAFQQYRAGERASYNSNP